MRKIHSLVVATTVGLVAAAAVAVTAAPRPPASSWRTDPAWDAGKAEWALYDATRTIYGRPRVYEATVFTNVQRMDRGTTTKSGRDGGDAVDVFKHNVSEMVPTEHYTYRFLTTSFVRRDDLRPYKLVMSSQEDCGATYRRFVVDGGQVDVESFCYFPDAGAAPERYRVPGRPENFAFHDMLTLTLRDYPFDADPGPGRRVKLVPDQTQPRPVSARPAEALVRYAGRETVQVPYGDVDAHHLRVEHDAMGGTTTSDYWFAADAALRHVLVRYEGPYGVTYELKRLAWWAYWAEPRP
ncbi:MAG: DUF3108 domain-containing protein [Planctomycetota bacterium]|jgi:hypothetical protein